VILMPPLSIKRDELARLVAIVSDSIEAATGGEQTQPQAAAA